MSFKEMLLKLKKSLVDTNSDERTKVADSLVSSAKELAKALDSSIDELIQRKHELEDEVESLKKHQKKPTTILDDKVDTFIEWYYKNMVKDHYTDIGEYHKPREMRNFIEKMAVWYELRYPDYEINRLMHCSGQEPTEVNNVMFRDNQYISDLLGNDSDIKDLDWDEFYNAHAFISSLSAEERGYFTKPKYYNLRNGEARLKLTPTGIIQDVEMLRTLPLWLNDNERVNIDKEFKGKHIEELVKFFKERASGTGVYKSLQEIVNNYNNQLYQKEEMLNCVMYRIIERGGNRIGPRRAFLFAKEFGRNIDIPMMYAVDRTDPGLRLFINEYLKSGGTKDLMCYVGYFSNTNKKGKLDMVSIQDLILTQSNNVATFYTPEETELHQRLVNVLSSQVDQSLVKQEEVKRLRLERKLERRIGEI